MANAGNNDKIFFGILGIRKAKEHTSQIYWREKQFSEEWKECIIILLDQKGDKTANYAKLSKQMLIQTIIVKVKAK